jgi:hypothetical protein
MITHTARKISCEEENDTTSKISNFVLQITIILNIVLKQYLVQRKSRLMLYEYNILAIP